MISLQAKYDIKFNENIIIISNFTNRCPIKMLDEVSTVIHGGMIHMNYMKISYRTMLYQSTLRIQFHGLTDPSTYHLGKK